MNILDALVARIEALEGKVEALEQSSPRPSREALGKILNKARHLPILEHGRHPKFWSDDEVRNFITEQHRRVEICVVVNACVEKFGKARGPSRSAVARYWLKLDDLIRRTA